MEIWLFIYLTGVIASVAISYGWLLKHTEGEETLVWGFGNLVCALLFSWAWAGFLIYVSQSE